MKQEPIDSVNPVSYRETVAPARFGQKLSDAIDEELISLAENPNCDYIRLEDVPAGVTSIISK